MKAVGEVRIRADKWWRNVFFVPLISFRILKRRISALVQCMIGDIFDNYNNFLNYMLLVWIKWNSLKTEKYWIYFEYMQALSWEMEYRSNIFCIVMFLSWHFMKCFGLWSFAPLTSFTCISISLQFDDIGSHGTKIIIYNLWLNNDGSSELDFASDPKVGILFTSSSFLSPLSCSIFLDI